MKQLFNFVKTYYSKILKANQEYQIYMIMKQLKKVLFKKSIYFYQGIEAVADVLQKNRTLEYLGLSKNNISKPDDLEKLFSVIGKQIMNQEEIDQYRIKEKEVNIIIEKNKKIKKKEMQDSVPQLDPISEESDGNTYISRNMKLYVLNLSENKLDESSKEIIEKLACNTKEQFSIILNYNKYDEKIRERFKKLYLKKIII